MKISKKVLKKIITEEVQSMLSEWGWGPEESTEERFAQALQSRKTEVDPEQEEVLEMDWINQLEDPASWMDCQKEGGPRFASRERCWELEDDRENFIRGALGREELPYRPVAEGKKEK